MFRHKPNRPPQPICPACKRTLRVPTQFFGHEVECAFCRHQFCLPGRNAVATVEEPSNKSVSENCNEPESTPEQKFLQELAALAPHQAPRWQRKPDRTTAVGALLGVHLLLALGTWFYLQQESRDSGAGLLARQQPTAGRGISTTQTASEPSKRAASPTAARSRTPAASGESGNDSSQRRPVPLPRAGLLHAETNENQSHTAERDELVNRAHTPSPDTAQTIDTNHPSDTTSDTTAAKAARRKALQAAQKRKTDEVKRSKGWIEYKGEWIAPEAFRDMAGRRPVTGQSLLRQQDQLQGLAVQIQGELLSQDGSRWTVGSRDSKGLAAGTVTVDATRLGTVPYRNAQLLQIWGIVSPAMVVEAVQSSLLPPGIRVHCELRHTPGFRGGQVQRYHVDGVVKNTGQQPLRRVTVQIRIYQISSPNDVTRQYTIENLAVGESRAITTATDFYNFEYIGATSKPKVQWTVCAYEF